MIVVTAGSGYLDIDAYACCFAYARMLNHIGIPAVIRTTVLGNETVTPGLLTKELTLTKKQHTDSLNLGSSIIYFSPALESMSESCPAPDAGTDFTYAIMDVSEPAYFEPFVKLEKVATVIDHHVGYKTYWENQIGDGAKIEFIGAAVTLVFEEIKRHHALSCIDAPLARLMMAAILDNTLNFTAGVTSERDHHAYDQLNKIAGNIDMAKMYFSECQAQIEASLVASIRADMKHITGEIYPGLPRHIGQLAVWDISGLMERKEEILSCLDSYGQEWMMNLISLKEGRSYLLAEDPLIKKNLEEKTGGVFSGGQMILDKAILRKELKKLFAICM